MNGWVDGEGGVPGGVGVQALATCTVPYVVAIGIKTHVQMQESKDINADLDSNIYITVWYICVSFRF